ncbi:MAG: GTP cyclohydrolase MptA [Thermoprotei archaeon]
MANTLPDVQSEQPAIKIPIGRVGLVNVVKEVVFNGSSKPYNVVASIDVYADLPKTQRGLHMSRPGEAIMDIIESASSISIKTFEALCGEISKRTLEVTEGSTYVETRLRGKMVIRSRSRVNNRVTSEPIEVFASAKILRSSNKTVYAVGARSVGMTVCPCALEAVRDYTKDVARELFRQGGINASDEFVTSLLQTIPIASHVQRGAGSIVVWGVSPGVVDVYDLVEIIEQSMSAPVQDVLKRTDEASLVRMGFSRPRFVEDVVRNMAYELVQRYRDKLEKDTLFILRQRNFESIHKHDVKAEIRATLDELMSYVSNIE